jgi:penicillin-binding protein 2
VQYLQTHQSDYPGVTVQTITQRSYTQGGTTATHVLGYSGDITPSQLKADPKAGYTPGSIVGQSGIEAQYEKYLRGVNGRQALSVNASGDVVGTLSHTAPQIGDTVVLNIDTGLQQAVQADLAAQIAQDRHTPDVEDHNVLPPAINGAAVVLNPQNGQVLAMASYPSYDLNQWVGGISTANFDALQQTGAENNYAIQGEYTPGSTFKLITATADLQDGVYSPSRYYNDTGTFKVNNCTGGTCNFSDNVGDSGGQYNLATALTVSSDSYFYNLGELFWEGKATYGANAIQNVAAQYGEGVSTGIDLPNEATGRVDSQSERQKLHQEAPTAFTNTTWYTGDNVEMAFGQGATALTPIEQAVAYATFANGGTRYAPEVASQIVDSTTGKVVQSIQPKVLGHVNLPAAVSGPILQGLEGAIGSKKPLGTAYSVFQGFPASWNLAGKTGTATNPGAKEPNSWFVAFGPNPNPQYVVLAVIDEGGYGAEAAAPLVRSIFDYIVANPIGAVKTPTAKTPPSSTAPVSNPPFGTPTTTTTTTTTTPTTTPKSTTTTTTTSPTTSTTTTNSPPGG